MNSSEADKGGGSARNETLARVEMAILAFILVMALVVNSGLLMALQRIRRERQMTRVHYLMLHLSVADILIAVFNVFPQLLWDITFRFQGPDWLCRSVKFAQVAPLYLSTLVLVTMAVDRYHMVNGPSCLYNNSSTSYQKWLRGSWIVSGLLAFPQIFIFAKRAVEADETDCWADFGADWIQKFYITSFVLVIFVLPLVTISFCYTSVVVTLHQLSGYVKRRHSPSACQNNSIHNVRPTEEKSLMKIKGVGFQVIRRNRTPSYPLVNSSKQTSPCCGRSVREGSKTRRLPTQNVNQFNRKRLEMVDFDCKCGNEYRNDQGNKNAVEFCKLNRTKDDGFREQKHELESVRTRWNEYAYTASTSCNTAYYKGSEARSDRNTGEEVGEQVDPKKDGVTDHNTKKEDIGEPEIKGLVEREERADDSIADEQKKIVKAKIKSMKLTLTILICYVIGWAPFCCTLLYVTYYPPEHESSYPAISVIFLLLANLNACLNPWIYIYFSKDVRKQLKEMLKEIKCHCTARSLLMELFVRDSSFVDLPTSSVDPQQYDRANVVHVFGQAYYFPVVFDRERVVIAV